MRADPEPDAPPNGGHHAQGQPSPTGSPRGRGERPADLVLRGGRVFDLVTGDLEESDVAICGDTVVGLHARYDGVREIDVAGRILVPGFIDAHLHIESSLVTPFEFDRCVTPARRHHRDLRPARDRERPAAWRASPTSSRRRR